MLATEPGAFLYSSTFSRKDGIGLTCGDDRPVDPDTAIGTMLLGLAWIGRLGL